MAVVEDLSEGEAYLYAILSDLSGVDQAEFLLSSPQYDTTDGCFRAYPYQFSWWRQSEMYQIEASARDVGKTQGILLSALAFPFAYPGEEMAIVGPEYIHLEPVARGIDDMFSSTRFTRGILKKARGGAVKYKPFVLRFENDAKIVGKIPQRDGRGIKGSHATVLHFEEAQDMPKCVSKNTLILVRGKGYVPASAVQVEDEVFTHKRRWRKVLGVRETTKSALTIKGHGHPGLVVGPDHPLLTIQRKGEYVKSDRNAEGHASLVRSLTFTSPSWVNANQITPDHYWATPASFPRHNGGQVPGLGQGKKLSFPYSTEEFMWVMGLYMADGWASDRQVTFACHRDESKEVAQRLIELGFHPGVYESPNSLCDRVTVGSSSLAEYLKLHCGEGAHDKQAPAWLYESRRKYRKAFFEGATFGDGCRVKREGLGDAWQYSTVSKAMACSMKTLAETLGKAVGWYWVEDDRIRTIRGGSFCMQNGGWYLLRSADTDTSQAIDHEHHRYQRITDVAASGVGVEMIDLEVEDDASFNAETIVVHNSAWTEAQSALRRSRPNAMWLVHGVTRGVQDEFWKRSQPGSGWRVFKITAMNRPTWTAEEKAWNIEEYGSQDDPDYRRNILGEHGDNTGTLFVQNRFFKIADTEAESEYNTSHFSDCRITDEMVAERDGDIISLLREDLPAPPTEYGNVFWFGSDLGWTKDPSEIMIFAEGVPSRRHLDYRKKNKKAIPPGGATVLTLIARVQMRAVTAPDQAKAFDWLIGHYGDVRAASLDSTGAGSVLVQFLQTGGYKNALSKIKGYVFGSKVLVGYQEVAEEETYYDEDQQAESEIYKAPEIYAIDVLRTLIDQGRLWIPFESSVVQAFIGQTTSTIQTDQYGNRKRGKGPYGHAFDAIRMAVVGWKLHSLEQISKRETLPAVLDVPVYDEELDYGYDDGSFDHW